MHGLAKYYRLGVCMHEVLQSVLFLWCPKDLLLFWHLHSQMPVVSGVCASSVYNSGDALLETMTVSTNRTGQRACRQEILANT